VGTISQEGSGVTSEAEWAKDAGNGAGLRTAADRQRPCGSYAPACADRLLGAGDAVFEAVPLILN